MTGLTQVWGFGSMRKQLSDGGTVLMFERVGSTMDIAREQVAKGKTDIVGVRAEYQSKGRGRSGSPWLAPPGACLLLTTILWPNGERYEPNHVSMASAVAVAEAIEEMSENDIEPGIKWPNDLLIKDCKIAGVLVEAVPHPDAPGKLVMLIGMGVNVNVDRFPEELDCVATSMEMESGMLYDIDTLEEIVRTRLRNLLALPFVEVLNRWRSRDVTAGRSYLTTTPDGSITGTATGVSDSGELILDTELGELRVMSATSVLPGETA